MAARADGRLQPGRRRGDRRTQSEAGAAVPGPNGCGVPRRGRNRLCRSGYGSGPPGARGGSDQLSRLQLRHRVGHGLSAAVPQSGSGHGSRWRHRPQPERNRLAGGADGGFSVGVQRLCGRLRRVAGLPVRHRPGPVRQPLPPTRQPVGHNTRRHFRPARPELRRCPDRNLQRPLHPAVLEVPDPRTAGSATRHQGRCPAPACRRLSGTRRRRPLQQCPGRVQWNPLRGLPDPE